MQLQTTTRVETKSHTSDAPSRRDLQKQRLLARERFSRARRLERQLSAQLAQVGRQVGLLVQGFAPRGEVTRETLSQIKEALRNYGESLRPWATAVVARMQSDLARRDVYAWELLAKTMGKSLKREVEQAPTGVAMRNLMAEQVHLITSLPTVAAERVHEWAFKGLLDGTRAKEVAKAIRETGLVTAGQARLIARTEVARTASTLTQARATHIGSEGYIWRTSGDSDVRKLHKALEGKFIAWDKPPISGERGERAHAGQIYNCRCWPEPVIPD